jgi:hypothetical protein
VRPFLDADVTAPRSRHNVHVTGPEDLQGIADWSRETLYRAVKFADDGDGGLVVLDYGRSNLYVASAAALDYRGPGALGLGRPPALAVDDPALYDPEGPDARPIDPVTVSPEFDILIPAFDPSEMDDDPLPPVDTRDSSTPTGFGTGTPG